MLFRGLSLAIARSTSRRSVIAALRVPILRLWFHSTPLLLGPKGKGKGKAGKGDLDDDAAGPPVMLPSSKDLEASMEKRLARLQSELSEMRGGRVTPDMFNSLTIEAHGARISLGEVGQATLKTSSRINIAVYDPDLVSSVVKGIRDSGHGLSPTSEGNNVIINVPKPSREAREGLVKQAGRVAERVKQELRGIRKDGLDAIKKLKGKVSEDDTKSANKDIESLVERKVEKVSKMLKDKEKELLADSA